MQPVEVTADVSMVKVGGTDGKVHVNKAMVIEGDLTIGHHLIDFGKLKVGTLNPVDCKIHAHQSLWAEIEEIPPACEPTSRFQLKLCTGNES